MPGWKRARDPRAGFTLIELAIVILILAVGFMIAWPRVADSRESLEMNRAVRTLTLDLEQALSLAARQRSEVHIVQPAGTRTLVVRDAADATVYLQRNFADGSSARLADLVLNPSQITISPTGRTSATLTVTVGTDTGERTITMSRAGQVRVLP